MSSHLPKYFALQSLPIEAIHSVSICGGPVALVVAYDSVGADHVMVPGLMPNRFYVLTGATHRFVRADSEGEALITFTPNVPVLITLVPVI